MFVGESIDEKGDVKTKENGRYIELLPNLLTKQLKQNN
jgi:hypothetical protein